MYLSHATNSVQSSQEAQGFETHQSLLLYLYVQYLAVQVEEGLVHLLKTSKFTICVDTVHTRLTSFDCFNSVEYMPDITSRR